MQQKLIDAFDMTECERAKTLSYRSTEKVKIDSTILLVFTEKLRSSLKCAGSQHVNISIILSTLWAYERGGLKLKLMSPLVVKTLCIIADEKLV